MPTIGMRSLLPVGGTPSGMCACEDHFIDDAICSDGARDGDKLGVYRRDRCEVMLVERCELYEACSSCEACDVVDVRVGYHSRHGLGRVSVGKFEVGVLIPQMFEWGSVDHYAEGNDPI